MKLLLVPLILFLESFRGESDAIFGDVAVKSGEEISVNLGEMTLSTDLMTMKITAGRD
jgi:hypothetical protein